MMHVIVILTDKRGLYMNFRRHISACGLLISAAALILTACNSNPANNGGGGKEPVEDWFPEYNCNESVNFNDGLNRERADLGLQDAVVITFNNGGAPTITLPGELDEHYVLTDETAGEHVVVRTSVSVTEYNFVLSGTTQNGSFKIYNEGSIRVYLNGADITNPRGPALNFQKNRRITVHTVGGCDRRNILADGPNYYDPPNPNDLTEQAKGTLFSEGHTFFTGNGSLEIRSRFRHAIAVDNFINIESGNIIVHESANDGIRANLRIAVTGGDLQIRSVGDAIQNRRGFQNVEVTGGSLRFFTTGVRSHGIASDSGNILIGGNANITITATGRAAKGFRTSAGDVEIAGGIINIRTSGDRAVDPANPADPADMSNAAGVRAAGNFDMTGGKLTMLNTGDNSKGIRANGNVTITNGDVHIRSHGDGIGVNEDMRIGGGNVFIRSDDKKGIDGDRNGTISGGGVTIEAHGFGIDISEALRISGGNVSVRSTTREAIRGGCGGECADGDAIINLTDGGRF
jgi:hypothetical protein